MFSEINSKNVWQKSSLKKPTEQKKMKWNEKKFKFFNKLKKIEDNIYTLITVFFSEKSIIVF